MSFQFQYERWKRKGKDKGKLKPSYTDLKVVVHDAEDPSDLRFGPGDGVTIEIHEAHERENPSTRGWKELVVRERNPLKNKRLRQKGRKEN